MKKRIISALLTVVMIMTMLTAMSAGALAAQIVEIQTGETYTDEALDSITEQTDISLLDSNGVATSATFSKNGITITATVAGDNKTLNLTYSGKTDAEGLFDIALTYFVGGNIDSPKEYTVTFNAAKPKTEVLTPEITSAEPANLNQTFKKSDAETVFKVNAVSHDNGTISYRWSVDGTEVGSGNSFTLIPEDMTVDTHKVVCTVSNTLEDTSKHDSITWTVVIEKSAAPEITSKESSATIDGTGSVNFEVTAVGTDLKYKWYMLSGTSKQEVVDGTYGAIEYVGAATNKLTVKCTLAPQNASTKFVCEVSNAEGLKTTSGEYILNIKEDPNAEKVQSIEVVSYPDKMEYIVGETLDQTGMEIKVTTGKGTEEIENGFVCSPIYLEEEGEQTITVSYGGKTTTFSVTVNKAPHSHEWSEWKVDKSSTPEKAYRECIAGDDCTAKEVLSKESFIVQYPTKAKELGLTMDDDAENAVKPDDTPVTQPDDNEEDTLPEDDKGNKDNEKKGGNAILWVIVIIAIILLAVVAFYYVKIYRKPYKKPGSKTNTRR